MSILTVVLNIVIYASDMESKWHLFQGLLKQIEFNFIEEMRLMLKQSTPQDIYNGRGQFDSLSVGETIKVPNEMKPLQATAQT